MLTDARTRLGKTQVQAQEEELRRQSALSETEHRLKAVEELYSETLRKLEGLEIKQDTVAGKIQVLKKEMAAPRPIGFSFAQRELLGLLSGTLLALVLLYTPQNRHQGLVTVSDASILATGGLPWTSDTEVIHRIMQVPALSKTRLALPMPGECDTHPHDDRLIAVNEPNSRKLEPFKGLKTNLQILIAETGARIVLVCSSRSGMGRSTLVANTGYLMAQDGYSVAVVDANFRKPSLHRIFDLENHQGLSTNLCGTPNPVLHQPIFSPNLGILPSGPIPPNPSELLGSKSMIKLLDMLKRRYDVVLIDTPPFLEFPDAGILTSISSGVVFLSRLGEPEKDVQASRDFLKNLRSNVLGFVQT